LFLFVIGLAVTGLAIWKFSPARETKNPVISSQTESPAAALPKLDLSEAQLNAANDFVAAAAAVSESLSADKIADFNGAAPQVGPTLEALRQSLPADHSWQALLQKVADSKLVPAGDLADARKEFLPFSTATADFVKAARQQNERLNSLKLYRCPMAPKPGLWMQLQGPLRNPYFGREMLDCGTEVAK
jgi:hypothetical protein